MVFIVKNKEDLEAVADRGRCIICGEIGGGSKKVSINKVEEHVVLCSPDCELKLIEILGD